MASCGHSELWKISLYSLRTRQTFTRPVPRQSECTYAKYDLYSSYRVRRQFTLILENVLTIYRLVKKRRSTLIDYDDTSSYGSLSYVLHRNRNGDQRISIEDTQKHSNEQTIPVVQMDLAENFNRIRQNDAQSVHWNSHEQATIFTIHIKMDQRIGACLSWSMTQWWTMVSHVVLKQKVFWSEWAR